MQRRGRAPRAPSSPCGHQKNARRCLQGPSSRPPSLGEKAPYPRVGKTPGPGRGPHGRGGEDPPGFRPGVSSATLQYLSSYTWRQVMNWTRRKHRRITWKDLRQRYCAGGWWPASEERRLFNPAKVRTTRYRYRGSVIPSPWLGKA